MEEERKIAAEISGENITVTLKGEALSLIEILTAITSDVCDLLDVAPHNLLGKILNTLESEEDKNFLNEDLITGIHAEVNREGLSIKLAGDTSDALFCVTGVLSAISQSRNIPIEDMLKLIARESHKFESEKIEKVLMKEGNLL